MRPRQQRDDGQIDLLRARLDQILNMDHPLVKLAAAINWGFQDKRLGEVYDDDPGRAAAAQPPDGGPCRFEVDARPFR